MSFRSRSSPWWEDCATLGHACCYCDKAAARVRRERLRLLDRLEYIMELREKLDKAQAAAEQTEHQGRIYKVLEEQAIGAAAALAPCREGKWEGPARTTWSTIKEAVVPEVGIPTRGLEGIPEHLVIREAQQEWLGIRRYGRELLLDSPPLPASSSLPGCTTPPSSPPGSPPSNPPTASVPSPPPWLL